MNGNRKIFFTITVDYKRSIEEIKSKKSVFWMGLAEKLLKVAAPFQTKIVLAFLKIERMKLLTGLNEYLQQYDLGEVGNLVMQKVTDQKILFQLENITIHYQKLSELDLIQKNYLKKVIRSMKYAWVEESVIALLNTEIVNKKVLKELSFAVSKLFLEKWGICAYISSFGVV